MDGITGATAGPVFSSSRIIRWSDLGDEERDKFARFFAENNASVSAGLAAPWARGMSPPLTGRRARADPGEPGDPHTSLPPEVPLPP
jgi:hypothetical protein